FEPQGGRGARRAEEEVSRDQVAGRRHARGRHRQRLRRHALDRARHRQGRLDRRAEDPRGLLRDRQARGADQELPEAVLGDDPRCALGVGLSVHLLQGRRDPAADELGPSAARRRPPDLSHRARNALWLHPGCKCDRETMLTSAIISGLGLGSMYGLIALGFHVTYVVSNTVNFAQGSAMMLGAVLGYTFAIKLGWPLPLAAL